MNEPAAAVTSSDAFASAPHSAVVSAVTIIVNAVDEPAAAVASPDAFAPAPHSAIAVTVSTTAPETKVRTVATAGSDAAFADVRCAAAVASAEAHTAGTHIATTCLQLLLGLNLAILLVLSPAHRHAHPFLRFLGASCSRA